MNSFPAADGVGNISQKRALELCLDLGRINAGMRCICLPEGGSGHAIAVLLESVIKNAGHCVGRVTSVGGFDSRSSIFVDGEAPSIEDYNRAVAELKSAVQRKPDAGYTKEETTFALGLLLCRISTISGSPFPPNAPHLESEYTLTYPATLPQYSAVRATALPSR